MSEIKLKPCPFCGGKAIQETGERRVWYDLSEESGVHCTNCKCLVEGDTAEEAIRLWNTRKPMEQIVERLEESSGWTESTFDEDGYSNDDSQEVVTLEDAIEIVKEVGGINE